MAEGQRKSGQAAYVRRGSDQPASGRHLSMKKEGLWSLYSWFESMSGSSLKINDLPL
jgi:hypothetical protein